MKKLYFLLIFIAGGFSLSAQSISIDHYNLDQGNDVIVSIDMQNMVNMGAITIFVGYDNTVLQYDTILNINSQFPGLMANNMNNTQIGMVWSAFLSGVTITSAELCQLRFNFLGNSSDLSFNPGCEIADFNAITIVTTFVNGSVSETIVASINGLAAGYCEDQSNITLSGLPAGGIFTIDGVTGTSFQPNILGPGSYTVNYMVTNAYNFGDTATQIVQVYEVPLVFVQTQDVICFGQSTGEATAFVSQGSSPYFYNWSDGQTTATAQNLVAGNHNIQIIDNNGCEAFTSFNINQGIEIIADINITHLSSLGAGNGAIDVTVSGGNPPYSYVWSDTSTSEDISNLDHGLYGLTIVDALLCEQQAEALVRVHSSQQFSIPDQWSMFSFNIEHYEPAVDSVLQAIIVNVQIVKNENGNVYWPIFNLNVIGDFQNGEGYQIKCDTVVSLTSVGFYLFPEEENIILPSGWSLFAYLRTSNISVETGMDNVVSNIILMKNGNGQVFWPLYNLNGIPAMIPGQGYQVRMNLTDTLVYPGN